MIDTAVIDIVAALDSVATAARGGAAHSLVGAAALEAVPGVARHADVASFLACLRRDPLAAAHRWDCTFGAMLVWRAVDRAECAGRTPRDAIDRGIDAAAEYLGLIPDRLLRRLTY